MISILAFLELILTILSCKSYINILETMNFWRGTTFKIITALRCIYRVSNKTIRNELK